jgi:formylglycine-generating enzyme required for sulfatase activity
MHRVCVVPVLVVLAASGCGGGASVCTGAPSAEAGTERGVCLPGGSCAAGLVCLSDLCVNPYATPDAVLDVLADGQGDADAVQPADGAEAAILDGFPGDPGFLSTCGDAGTVAWTAIPGAQFQMGATDIDPTTLPVHAVTVPGFSMAQSETTVCQYQACVLAGRCSPPEPALCGLDWDVAGKGQDPVNCVTWDQAVAFCGWAGGRLCSEAEWEFAARNGATGNLYPWGDSAPTCDDAVYADCETGASGTEAACGKPAGSDTWGVCDLAGNVAEWVEDDYHNSYSGAPADGSAWIDSPRGARRVTRGGDFLAGGVNAGPDLRASARDYDNAATWYFQVGVRCCLTAGQH